MRQKQIHWGKWTRRRARSLGILTVKRLSHLTGFHPTSLCRILCASNPPKWMLYGRDEALARTLGVTLKQLFADYSSLDPGTLLPFPPGEQPIIRCPPKNAEAA